MANAVIADSIAPVPEWQVWCDCIRQSLSDIDLSKLLVYIIDSVDASAIPYLAQQFDVLGYGGMRMATTEAMQRALIENAILLHKYKGTEWAIMQALATIGFTDIRLKKGAADGYDHWAKFGIEITNTDVPLTEQNITDIIAVIMEYKRAVCVLMDISISLRAEDTISVSDGAALIPELIASDTISLSSGLLYDGKAQHDGEHNYSGEGEIATLTPN